LVDFRVPGEHGDLCDHFDKYRAYGPDIDRSAVLKGAEEDLGGTVPERDDFVGVWPEGKLKGTSETEIRDLYCTFAVKK
jgi:hypothetical protein